MSVHTIPAGVDFAVLVFLTQRKMGRSFSYDGNATVQPTEVQFTPDLTAPEQIVFSQLIEYTRAVADFDSLPDWATWTAAEAGTNITSAIFAGSTAAAVKANIASTLTDITTANVSQINARLAVIRTLLGNAVDAIIAIRGILANMGKAIVYLRNLVVKIR